MTSPFWRRGAKFAAFLDIIFTAAILFTIVGLAAVEVAEQRLAKREKVIEVKTSNATDTAIKPDGDKGIPVELWKLWAGAIATFVLTGLHIWASGRLFRGASPDQPLESAKRIAVVWILLKILLDIVGISIQIIIFKAYVLVGVGIPVRLVLLAIVIKYAKEVKAAINAE